MPNSHRAAVFSISAAQHYFESYSENENTKPNEVGNVWRKSSSICKHCGRTDGRTDVKRNAFSGRCTKTPIDATTLKFGSGGGRRPTGV